MEGTVETDGRPVDFGKLKLVAWLAFFTGLFVLCLALWMFGQFEAFDIGASAMAAAFAAIAWSAVFYFGCLIVAGSLTSYIVGDDTRIRRESVEHVTTTRSSGDDRLDRWIDHFVFARNTFGLAIVPVLILVGLYLWG